MSEVSQLRATPAGLLAQIKPLIRTMRPKQYTKNVFVWAALLFDRKLFEVQPFLRTLHRIYLVLPDFQRSLHH